MGNLCTTDDTVAPDVEKAKEILTAAGQPEVIKTLEEANAEGQMALAKQVVRLDTKYPGGLEAYVKSAKELLAASKAGANPFEGYAPQVPAGERLVAGSEEFTAMEAKGMEAIKDACFVLVAGGLGERLGYNGIKVALPHDTASGDCYLQRYCQHIQALQAHAIKASGDESIRLPFFIMTSGDTHDKTMELLEANKWFGMKDQITVIPQDKVPALVDNDAHFAMDGGLLETKPHGHGDVHMVLAMNGIADQWAKEGRKWVCFIQDTNGLVFHAIPAAVGVSVEHDFDVNSLTVPRKPKEAVGGICLLANADKPADDLTLNVEYNQLDSLFKSAGMEGDVAQPDGFSAYPGNINVLVFKLEPYAQKLKETGGAIAEFVNPKYADEEKMKFKKPTRLECMMQDYPKLLKGTDSKVGFTQMDRWACFSAVKNNCVDAASKPFPESAATGEQDGYLFYRKALGLEGAEGDEATFRGIKIGLGAHVIVRNGPGMASFAGLKAAFPNPGAVKISPTSSLVIDGDVLVEALELDGALTLTAEPGKQLVVNLTGDSAVKNEGWVYEPVPEAELENVPQETKMRGYTMKKNATACFSEAGMTSA